MSLMGSLYVGSSGLAASQNAINTSAHNLSNVDTKGYVRQQTVLKDTRYQNVGLSGTNTKQVGLGVDTQIVRQVRDQFLDKSYRAELGRRGFYDSQFETVSEIESLFGEIDGVAYQDTLENLWESLEELSKEPDSLVTRATVIQTSVAFLERSQNIFSQLSEYQLNLNTQIETKVNRINEIATEIKSLNDQICYYEAGGVENANDLRDSRNLLLDELGQLASITYRENSDGKVMVSLEGMSLVNETMTFSMGTMTVLELEKMNQGEDFDEESVMAGGNTGMLVPVWKSYGNAEVFNFDVLPTSEKDTDIGSLKGLILARGEKVGKYIDIPVAPKEEDYIDETGILDEDAYEEAYAKYEENVRVYNDTIDSSICVASQAQFDQLVHGIVTTLNNILSPNKEVVVPAGTTIELADGSSYTYEEETTIRIFDEENAPVGMDENATGGTELFSRKSTPRYTEPQDIMLTDGTVITARIYNEEKSNDNYSLYTLGELEVNGEILENPSLIALTSNDGTGDYDIETTKKLIDAWNQDFATLSPNVLTMSSFKEYYNSFTGSVATVGERFNTIASNQANVAESIESQRLSLTGVSSDEELTDLIKYQHAYSAAARYVNVVDQMIEQIVTQL